MSSNTDGRDPTPVPLSFGNVIIIVESANFKVVGWAFEARFLAFSIMFLVDVKHIKIAADLQHLW